jgi:hypothetical protein
VKKTENGLLVQLAGDILFETNSAILKPEAVDQISKVGDVNPPAPGSQLPDSLQLGAFHRVDEVDLCLVGHALGRHHDGVTRRRDPQNGRS